MAVDLRICAPQLGASYHDLLRVARCTEDAGFDGFFCADHYLRIRPGDGLPGPTDAWTTLAGLARDTSRMRLGTLMTAATFRLPGPLAITVAQADHMSRGRIEFGVGVGWFEPEHTAYGIPFPPLGERFDRLTEQLDIITGLWSTPAGATFDYQGSYYQLNSSPAGLTPMQPRIPVLIGGSGPRRTPALAARFASEYNQIVPAKTNLGTVAAQFERVSAACTRIGRDPRELIRSVLLTVCVGRDDDEVARRAAAIGQDVEELRRDGLAGTPAEVVDRIGQWRECTGISRLYLRLLNLDDLDHVDVIAEEILRAV